MKFEDIERILLLEINVSRLDSTGLTEIENQTFDWQQQFDKFNSNLTPIERVMKIILFSIDSMFCRELGNGDSVPFIRIKQQEKIGKYYADFEIEFIDQEKKQKYIIECDGHDFHEKTKEQATYDKIRERFFVKNGYKVFRFSGSEIYNNFEQIKDELYDILADDYYEKNND